MEPLIYAVLGVQSFSPAEVAAIVAICVAAQYVFSCMVQSLPKPRADERFYQFLFSFAHTLAANTGLVRDTAEKLRASTFRPNDTENR